jgi:hypothetical protein
MFSKSYGYLTIIFKSVFLNIQNNQNQLQIGSSDKSLFTSKNARHVNTYTPPISTFGFPS